MAESTLPPVPGLLRLAWLFFMQPLRLREASEAWGLPWRRAFGPTLWQFSQKLRIGDPVARALVHQLATWLFVVLPVVALGIASMLQFGGVEMNGPLVVYIALFGVSIGVFGSAFFGVFGSVFAGVAIGVFLLGILGGDSDIRRAEVFLIGGIVLIGVFIGVFVGAFGGVFRGLFIGLVSGVVIGVLAGVLVGGLTSFLGALFGGVVSSPSDLWSLGGRESAMVFASIYLPIFFVSYFRLPIYFLEATRMLAFANNKRLKTSKLAGKLPFRHHDVILLPLPGLRSFLVTLGKEDPTLAQQVLAEAAESVAQKRPARLALAELQASSLEKAARGRLFDQTAALDLDFLSVSESRFAAFQEAGQNLKAARDTTNQHYQERALEGARKILADAQTHLAGKRRLTPEERRLQPTLRVWLDTVHKEKLRFEGERKEYRQVPTPFITGPALGPTDPDSHALFKGRRDLIRLIDQDLTSERREPIVLIGQRRMGKTSLLNMLPQRLGTVTRVVPLSFQGLSGSEHRGEPHQLIVDAVAGCFPGNVSPPRTPHWGPALDWLHSVDRNLAKDDQRLLITIDEVEGLQRGIREGWGTPEVLDLIRAAGDQLRQIRFLLTTAHPLPRLGPQWVDRLINVVLRRLGPLDAADATELICYPVPDVDHSHLYPEGSIDRILRRTAGHPYLIQLTCDALCRHLNEERRHQATPEDLDRAFDRVLLEAPLFDELWRQRTDDEKRLLRDLAGVQDEGDTPKSVCRELEREGYLARSDDKLEISVPLFATWIAEET